MRGADASWTYCLLTPGKAESTTGLIMLAAAGVGRFGMAERGVHPSTARSARAQASISVTTTNARPASAPERCAS
jgi:hypothetical protein